jgi:CheY-like chemotaxis protein
MRPVPERARVLVVDDEPIVRELVARYLARAGCEVNTAADGDAALAAWRSGERAVSVPPNYPLDSAYGLRVSSLRRSREWTFCLCSLRPRWG